MNVYTTINLDSKNTRIVKLYGGFHCRNKTYCFLSGFTVPCLDILKMNDNSWKMMFLLLTRQEFRFTVWVGGESVKIWKAAIKTVKSEGNGLKAF